MTELKWTKADFEEERHGRLPMGKSPDEWTYGDLDSGFKNATTAALSLMPRKNAG